MSEQLPTFRIYITDTYVVRFAGHIAWWQRMFMWMAGINTVRTKDGE